MTKQTKALKLALEALEYISSHYMSLPKIGCMALAAVEEALTAQKTCLVANESCKHGSWCSEVYCQEHCKFVEQPAQQQEPSEYVQKVIDALYENSDPVSVEAAELLEQMTQQQEPLPNKVLADAYQCGFHAGRKSAEILPPKCRAGDLDCSHAERLCRELREKNT